MELKNRRDDEEPLVKQLSGCGVCGRNGCGLQHRSTGTLQIWKSEAMGAAQKDSPLISLWTSLCGPAFCGPTLLYSLLIWLPTWRSQTVLGLVIAPLLT